MVNSLLDLARSEWRRLPVNPECVVLKDLIGQACTSFEAAARAKKISLQYHVPAKFPPVLADPARIREVLVNLIDNAIKYGRTGGAVDVTAHYSDADPTSLKLTSRTTDQASLPGTSSASSSAFTGFLRARIQTRGDLAWDCISPVSWCGRMAANWE